MYATVRRYEGVTDPSEAGRRVNEGFLPLISKVPGFVAYYWVDAGAGVMISTSVFQDQSGAEESNKRAADYVRENLASLLPKPPQITAGEVVAGASRQVFYRIRVGAEALVSFSACGNPGPSFLRRIEALQYAPVSGLRPIATPELG